MLRTSCLEAVRNPSGLVSTTTITECIDMERFWNKVDKAADCWLWTAAKNAGGYGRFSYKGANRLAHRVSWELCKGSPAEKDLCHTCDVPSCVNPKHLYEGDHSQNMADMVLRGRSPSNKGERNPCRKLTYNQVRYIRYSSAKNSNLADAFGVTLMSIYNIRKRKTWAEVV